MFLYVISTDLVLVTYPKSDLFYYSARVEFFIPWNNLIPILHVLQPFFFFPGFWVVSHVQSVSCVNSLGTGSCPTALRVTSTKEISLNTSSSLLGNCNQDPGRALTCCHSWLDYKHATDRSGLGSSWQQHSEVKEHLETCLSLDFNILSKTNLFLSATCKSTGRDGEWTKVLEIREELEPH